jgi:aryl-alcohol dehydrogenase-like predicted oxidoreductase
VELRRLGSTQRSVSCVGMGSMPLAIQARPSEEDALRVLHTAFEAGIDWVDTADSYCLGEEDVGYGERLIARALRERGGANEIFVTTKAGYVRPNGGWELDCRPERLKAACEASLRALGVSSIRQACEIVNVATVQNRCNVYECHCFANGVIEAWLLGRSQAMLVIPGASRSESVHSSVSAAPLKQLVGARREGRRALRWAKQRLRGTRSA